MGWSDPKKAVQDGCFAMAFLHGQFAERYIDFEAMNMKTYLQCMYMCNRLPYIVLRVYLCVWLQAR